MPGPTGLRLDDGHSSQITFSADTTIGLWEKDVTPPSADGGEAVDTTTMRNTRFRTKSPRKLVDTGEATIKVAYDPNHLTRIRALVNVPGQVTFTYPTGQPDVFWAYLRKFTPDALTEGAQATATIVITPTNQDLSGVETAPALGTTTSTTTTTTTTTA